MGNLRAHIGHAVMHRNFPRRWRLCAHPQTWRFGPEAWATGNACYPERVVCILAKNICFPCLLPLVQQRMTSVPCMLSCGRGNYHWLISSLAEPQMPMLQQWRRAKTAQAVKLVLNLILWMSAPQAILQITMLIFGILLLPSQPGTELVFCGELFYLLDSTCRGAIELFEFFCVQVCADYESAE